MKIKSKLLKLAAILLAGVYVSVLGGCSRGPADAGPEDIDSPHPSFKAVAMLKTVEQDMTSNLARQVELLGDEDPAVRFYAILSLKKLTGTDNGYDYRHDAVRRREAIERWKQWLADNGDSE